MEARSAEARQTILIEPVVLGIESNAALDAPAKAVAGVIRDLVPAGALKDILSGTWLGHAVHPMLTDVVIGSFTSATALDFIAGRAADAASRKLIGLGIAAYAPTALTGMSDWADSEPADVRVRRAGLVHAAVNATALSFYAASLIARRRGARKRGVLMGTLGAGVLGVGGYLGGHLSLRRGVGVDQTAFDPGPSDWTAAGKAEDLREGEPRQLIAGDAPILLLRRGTRIFAIHDRCSHRGCSLAEGEIDGEEVVCACHGSRFALTDGAVRKGPATAPQPAFEVRERDGSVEVRALTAG